MTKWTYFFFSSRRRHTRLQGDWSSDVCSSDLRELGYRIKLLAIAKAADGGVEVRVHPTMIPAGSPLAAVAGVFNAIFITGDAVGDLMFYGRGAGQLPPAPATWAAPLDIARRIAHR